MGVGRVSVEQTHRVTSSGALSLGFLWPRTKVIALNRGQNQPYHISGYGAACLGIVRYHYGDTFFVDVSVKGGWLHYVNAYSFEPIGHTSQSYWFLESIITAGVPFRL